MFEAGAGRGEKVLDEFGFAEFADEAQGVAADVFVGVLEVHADAVAGLVLVCLVRRHCAVEFAGVMSHQTSIISCFNFPFESSFGQIS